jgi:uncharacterized membrane protein
MSDRLEVGSAAGVNEDKTLPVIVYVLYLLGLANGITILIGLIIAYSNRALAGPKAESHYTFLINTFWFSIVWFVIGGALCLFGGALSIILVGIPFLMLGLFICGAVGVWFAVRCVVGLIYLSRDEAYPRPMNWLI